MIDHELTISKINSLALAIAGSEQQVAVPPTKHYFIEKTYVRTMEIPAQTLVVGKVHKTHNILMCIKGHAIVATEQGSKQVGAGDIFEVFPGQQRAAYALEDCVFVNIHHNPDDETDLQILEQRYSDMPQNVMQMILDKQARLQS